MSKKHKIRAIIVDDIAQARLLLKLMLEDIAPHVHIIAEAVNLQEAIIHIKNQKPDLVFLDVEMPLSLGVQIYEFIPEQEYDFEIIFTTAYQEYALNAIKMGAADYLLKPIQPSELEKAIEKIQGKLNLKQSSQKYESFIQTFQNLDERKITLPGLRENAFIHLENIIYLEAQGTYTNFHLVNESPKLVSKNLKEFEDELKETSWFYRPHRSYLINTRKMKSFTRQPNLHILMEGGHSIPVSRQKKAEFLSLFGDGKS